MFTKVYATWAKSLVYVYMCLKLARETTGLGKHLIDIRPHKRDIAWAKWRKRGDIKTRNGNKRYRDE